AIGDRPNIWRNSLDLVSDYPLTGFGLSDFEMTYSTYALLVHVGNTLHAHDLWLNVWLEQGLLGFVALAGLTLNSIWPKPSSPWRLAALAALAVMLLHSLADDPFYGYDGVAIPLLFIPLGLLARLSAEDLGSFTRFQPALIIWGVAAIGLVVGLILPGGRAIFEANLGTVAQTRAELSVYHWPEMPIQDALRRSRNVDLTAAIAHYWAALALDPANASANRRLGQIELSQGNYDSACTHLKTAYQVAPQQRATRQLLGECDALNNSADRAVELWRTIDLGQSQLDIREWWYSEYLADYDRAAKLKQAIDELNN
ncbi:MAG TPA: O-antigen ligase family protein, partial [Anaerolineae bacterium]|nr:O-antigen ligase family protein [Anaerolineae bacterium]